MGGEPLTKDQLRKYVSDGDKWIKTLGRLNPEFSNSYDDALLIGKNLNEKDVQNLENNSRLRNKVRKTIDGLAQIQFKNEIFSITKVR